MFRDPLSRRSPTMPVLAQSARKPPKNSWMSGLSSAGLEYFVFMKAVTSDIPGSFMEMWCLFETANTFSCHQNLPGPNTYFHLIFLLDKESFNREVKTINQCQTMLVS